MGRTVSFQKSNKTNTHSLTQQREEPSVHGFARNDHESPYSNNDYSPAPPAPSLKAQSHTILHLPPPQLTFEVVLCGRDGTQHCKWVRQPTSGQERHVAEPTERPCVPDVPFGVWHHSPRLRDNGIVYRFVFYLTRAAVLIASFEKETRDRSVAVT